MEPRINYYPIAKEALKGMFQSENYLSNCRIEKSLVHLVKLRASQINNCAYCIDMHWKDLRALGESEQRLYGLMAWRESPYYTDRERAAFEWTDSVTLLTDGFVPDEIFEKVRPHFSDEELVDLTLTIAIINAWNRMAVPMRSKAGEYQPPAKH